MNRALPQGFEGSSRVQNRTRAQIQEPSGPANCHEHAEHVTLEVLRKNVLRMPSAHDHLGHLQTNAVDSIITINTFESLL